jgi:hypothetical protein
VPISESGVCSERSGSGGKRRHNDMTNNILR